ncbi:MAG: hypothetical protein JST01_29070 [Cyanobacteria bacterium SZAS TMP-1]|nr:hypothetical protein [Cyanobacteria bacterium SZAS TMP-1]
MLTTASGTDSGVDSVVVPPCTGSHSPDPETMARPKPAACALSKPDSERILAAFSTRYVGVAHGIVKAELEVKDDNQRILVYVDDWNGVVNIPTSFQGMTVVFMQYVPEGSIWQL